MTGQIALTGFFRVLREKRIRKALLVFAADQRITKPDGTFIKAVLALTLLNQAGSIRGSSTRTP